MEIFVNDQVKSARSDVCKSCDNLTFINTCSICNCYMPAKVKLPSAFCPELKWQAVSLDTKLE
jgi:rRNA maturation protein Nop10